MKKVPIASKPTAAAVPPTPDDWVNAPETRNGAAESPQALAMKRLTIDIPEDLHTRIKTQCAQRRSKMADEIRELLERNYPA